MQGERRENNRYTIRDKAFAVIDSELVKMMPIIDIGMGGLGVCADDASQIKASHLEILVEDCSFYLDRIPFKTIFNAPVACSSPFHSAQNNRCGLEFGGLMPSQILKLRYFIRNYTRRGTGPSIVGKFYDQLHHLWSKKHMAQACENLWRGYQYPSL